MNHPSRPNKKQISRRDVLKLGMVAGAVSALAAGRNFVVAASDNPPPHHAASQAPEPQEGMSHGDYSGTMGEVDLTQFDPTNFLTNFDYGKESTSPEGNTIREWDVVATEKEIEIAPGVLLPSLDLQRTGSWTHLSLPGRRFAAISLYQWQQPSTYHPFPWFPPTVDGRC